MTLATRYDIRPVDTSGARTPAASIYTGTLSMFESAGFEEVLRRAGRRPVMRLNTPRPVRGNVR